MAVEDASRRGCGVSYPFKSYSIVFIYFSFIWSWTQFLQMTKNNYFYDKYAPCSTESTINITFITEIRNTISDIKTVYLFMQQLSAACDVKI